MPKTQTLRYTVDVVSRDEEGWTGGTTHWCSTKNRAFLDAARIIGSIYARKGTVLDVKIVDGRTGDNVHVPGDDLYWLY